MNWASICLLWQFPLAFSQELFQECIKVKLEKAPNIIAMHNVIAMISLDKLDFFPF